MEEKDIFRTAVFGGYQKDDVTDYIRSLENENETIRILANKEKSDLKTQLEKEKAVSEELKTSLAALHDRLSDLEKNRPEETPYSPAPSEAAREDALKYSLEEERRAIREDRQQWADNLAKMQQDMQSLWQNELQQLRSTLETIQSNLKQPACEPQDAAGPVPAAAYPEKEQTEGSHIQPESGQPEAHRPLLPYQDLSSLKMRHLRRNLPPLCRKARSENRGRNCRKNHSRNCRKNRSSPNISRRPTHRSARPRNASQTCF